MSLKSELRKKHEWLAVHILSQHNSSTIEQIQECGCVERTTREALDLLDKSLPGSKPFEKGYNQALADVRKVIKEEL